MQNRDNSVRVTSCFGAPWFLGALLLWGCSDGENKKTSPDARRFDAGSDFTTTVEAGRETGNPIEPPASDANSSEAPSGRETGDSNPRLDMVEVQVDGGIDGGGLDGGGSSDTGTHDGALGDGSMDTMDTKAWSLEVDYVWDVLPKRDAYVIPTDQQSCVQATGVPRCDLSIATADIVPTTAGQLIDKAEVTNGACTVTSCQGGCERLSVFQSRNQLSGSTCDLRVTLWDGGQQLVHLVLVANPSPRYACCGYPQPPYAGQWGATNPVLFQPNPIFVTSPIDGGSWDAPRIFDAPAVDVLPPSER